MNLTTILKKHGYGAVIDGVRSESGCPFCAEGKSRLVGFLDQELGGRYFCRKCGATGDAVDLLEQLEGTPRSEGIKLVDDFALDCDELEGQSDGFNKEIWETKVAEIADIAAKLLRHSFQPLKYLKETRGLSDETIEQYNIGYVEKDFYIDGEVFGRQGEPPKKVFIPRGISIPTYCNAKIVGLKVRRPEADRRYHKLAGSNNVPLRCGDSEKVIVIVESELCAILIEQETDGLCSVIAMGSCSCRPDEELDLVLKDSTLVLIALDGDEYGANNVQWWLDRYSNARRWMIPRKYGKDPSEAFQNGLSLRDWVVAALPPLLQPDFMQEINSEAKEAQSIFSESEEDIIEIPLATIKYRFIENEFDMDDMYEDFGESELIYIDAETYSEAIPIDEKDIPAIDPFKNKIRLLSLSDGRFTYVVDLEAILSPERLFGFLSDKVWVGHNLSFDIKSLITDYGKLVIPNRCYDTMIAAQLLQFAETPVGQCRGFFGLAGCANRHLFADLDKDCQASDWSGDLTEEQIEYAANDVIILPDLKEELDYQLSHVGFSDKAVRTEMDYLLERVRIELAGIPIDVEGLRAKNAELKPIIKALNLKFIEKGINPRSQKQLLEYLNDSGFDLQKTDKDTLAEYQGAPVVDELLELRVLEHSFKYAEKALAHEADGYLFPEYRQVGAPTGRMGCFGVNLQAIPRTISHLIEYPPAGYSYLTVDLPAIEMRIAAIVAEDEVLTDCFKTGRCPHVMMASRISGIPESELSKDSPERKKAKAANFGFLYGMGAATFQKYAKAQGVDFTFEEAELFKQEFLNTFPGIALWHREAGLLLRESEDQIYVKKFDEYIPAVERESQSGRIMKAVGYCAALNYPVQGTGADMIKEMTVEVGKALREQELTAEIVHTVHDDIRLLCPNGEVDAVEDTLNDAISRVAKSYLKDFETFPEIKVIAG
jgi:DNA polymerase-1